MKPKLGATGRFPYGRSAPDDQGELCAGLYVDSAHGVLRLQLGKPVTWLGMTSGQAREFAKALIEKADELDRRKA